MDKLERLQKDFERDMERAQKEFGESLNDVISNADILLNK
jgi:predicted outer membrane protein